MYASEAYAVSFGNGFTDIIRRPGSWEKSDAWALLPAFTGHLMIVAAENDTVIPTDVIDRIYTSAVNAKEKTLYVVPKASHFAFTYLRANDPAGYEHVMALIVRMLKK